jgi:hypothetical protein
MSKITFDHAVIYNGTLYPANAEIEVKEPKEAAEPNKPEKEAVKNNDKRTSKNSKPRNRAD